MSELRVDTITDELGTGSPDFPNGITVSNGVFDTSTITASTIEDGAITGGTIDGATIGGTTAGAGTFTNFEYTGTLTGGTGVVNLGSGQVYKDAAGNVGIGTSSPGSLLHLRQASSAALGAQFTLQNNATSIVGNAVEIALLTDAGASPSAIRSARIRAVNENTTNGAANMQFWTWNGSSDAERMRITSAGNVGIGTTSPDTTRLIVRSQQTDFSGSAFIVQNGNNSTLFNVFNQGTFAASIFSGAGTNTVKYNTANGIFSYDTSSERYKKNIKDTKYGLSDVNKLRAVDFQYKESGRPDVGLIAEEVYQVIPELVALDKENRPDAVSYDRMVAVLIKAVQELTAKVEQLEAQINAN